MNRHDFRFLLTLLAFAATTFSASAQDGLLTIQGRKASASGLLVKVKDGGAPEKMQAAKGGLGRMALKSRAEFRVKGLMLVGKDTKGRAGAAMTNAELELKAKELMATGLYEYVEPDWILTVNQVPTDSAFANGTLWGLKNTGQNGGIAGVDVNAQPAWALTTGSPAVIVGVVDTGIRYTHQDLAANMWVNPGEIAGNGIDDDANGYIDDIHGINGITNSGDPMDDNSHGSHCAGTIGAVANNAGQIVGVAWNVKLMALKFLSASGSGSTSDAIKCIDYGVAKGAQILSNSWGGGPYSQSLRDSIAAASAAGVLFVAAAGNSSSNNDVTQNFPSNYDPANVVAVAAVDRTGTLATFSSYGATTVDVGAPGVAILSSTAASDTSYDTYNGTSMATPHVAGVAALIKSHYPAATMLEIKQRLMATTRPLASLAGRTVTGGIVDAHAALTVAADGVLELRATAASTPLSSGTSTAFYVTVSDLSPVTGATVTAALDAGTAIPFLDNGTAPDVAANDGIYSASLNVPATGSSTTLNVTASNGGAPVTGAFAFQIIARPPNDDFASRILLAAGTTQTTGSNVLSTFESGEPRYPSVAGAKSVWWEWAAGTSGSVTVTTSGSSYDTTLAVYSGSGTLASLVHLGSNDDFSGLTSSVTFTASSGSQYYFQVNGYGGSEGSITLNYPSPANVNSPPVIVTQPLGAVLVAGDPLALSVTASGTAPLSYQWALNGTNIPGATAAGYSVSSVTTADQGSYTVTITNAHGTITSAGAFITVDPISVRPLNDQFVNADILAGATGRVSGSNLRASGESGEPNHAAASTPIESVWYRWTAPVDGTLSIDTYGSSLDTTLAVYTGMAVDALTQVAANNDSGGVQSFVSVAVTAGQVLSIAVDGAGTAESLFSLNYFFQPTVAGLQNDAFANRQVVSGAGGTFSGTNVTATGETGEPVHDVGAPPTASVWWAWTAPENGVAVIDTLGSDFDTVLAVYTGAAVDALTPVAASNDAGGPQSRVAFPCSAGTAYVIAVDGHGAAEGFITLNITTGISEPEIAVEEPVGNSLVDDGTGLTWGNVAIGNDVTRTFTVRNTGGARLTGLSVRIEGAQASEFVLTNPPAASLNGGANTTFTVRFSPASLGARTAVLRLASNDADENPFDISLGGSGVAPAPEIVVEEPVGMDLADGAVTTDFGNVAVGSTGSRTYTVRNAGNATISGLAVTIGGSHAADFTVVSSPAATVAPGGATSFTLSFAPGGFGPRNAAMMIASNDADENPFDIALTGSGSASPPVTRTINATDRGWYAADGTHTPTNSNYLTGISGSGTPVERRSFFVFDVPALAANETVVSAELRLANPSAGYSSADPSEALDVHQVTTSPGILIAGTAGMAGFDDLADGALLASPKNVSGSDNGATVVVPLNSAALAEIRGRAGSQMAFGGSLSTLTGGLVQFVFGSSNDGNMADTQLVITTLTSYSDAEIVVEQPVGAGLTSGVSNVNFGGIVPGATADRDFTIRNVGIYNLTGLGLTITGANAADFSVTASPAAPLAPAGYTSFTVRFAPMTGGMKSATLRIASNDPDENPFEIALAGSGLVPAPEIAVEQPAGTGLADGVSSVGFVSAAGSSASLNFTVRNEGTIDLTGLILTIDGLDAADFSVATPPASTVLPGATTSFVVRFDPATAGSRIAALHIASNDADENPFDITLNGTTSQFVLEDDFDPGIDTPLWSAFGGTVTANTAGQAAGPGSTGNSLHFDGSGSRFATTIPVNVTGGGGISFKVALGNGSAPWETADGGEDVVLEYSNDGSTYTQIGGPYTNRPWQSVTVGIPAAAQTSSTRFRWRQLSNSGSGYDHWAIEDVQIGPGVTLAPEIAVEQPAGTGLTDGVSTANFGSPVVGTNTSRTFTVRNNGSADLVGLAVSIDGSHASDFSVTTAPAATVAPGATTTLVVRFAPAVLGSRSAALHIASNDADENPFDIALTGNGGGAPAGLDFKILSLGATGSAVVDHDLITGDDRGGIAVGTDRVFVTGDNATSGHALDLTGGASIGRISNGLCSDLGTGTVYVLANNGVEVFGSGGTVTQLIELNPLTGALTATIIPLSSVIVTNGTTGVFSGNGRVVLYTNARVYDILVPSGLVTDAGPMTTPSWTFSESWAVWGVAEYFGGSLHLAYRSSTGSNIVRSRVPDGQVETIATFSDLSDLASWTVSIATGRWYFHHEYGAQFGGSSETLGYADATFEMGPPTQPPVITSPLVASATTGVAFSYQIGANRSPTSYNATGLPAWLSVNTATGVLSGMPTSAGTHAVSISATNVVGTTTETLTITVTDTLTALFDDFDPGIDAPLWSAFGGTVTANSAGQAAGAGSTGNSLHFDGTGSRFATTVSLDVRAVNALSFLVALGNATSPWENADSGEDVVVEYSTDGSTFTQMGGPYTNRAWQSIVVGIPAAAKTASTRFRWRQLSNSGSGTDHWAIENVRIDSSVTTAPEIAVEQPAGTGLVDGVSSVSFGSVGTGTSTSRTFTVRNAGSADLTGVVVSIDGANAAEFVLVAAPAPTVTPGATTTFVVQFTPGVLGSRTAVLHISSNDADEAPFDISMTGTGVLPLPEIAVEQPTGTSLADGVSTVGFGTTLLALPVSRTFTIRNTGFASLTGIAVTFSGSHAADWSLTAAPATTLAAGASTTFSARFSPAAIGARSASLHIASNDADENPFDLALTGTAVPAAGSISLFANSSYVDTSSGGEMENTRSALISAGYNVVTFTGITDADWNSAFSADAVVVPELEVGSLTLSAAAISVVNGHVDSGKGLLVMGDTGTNDSTLLNTLRGWSLASGGLLDGLSLTKVAGVPGFVNSPSSLTGPTSTYSITTTSLPAGAQPVYQNGANTAVFLNGRVGFMAFDWFAGPDSAWGAVLGDLLTELTAGNDGPEIVVERPAGTSLVDGAATAALGYAPVGGDITSTFTIRNAGNQPLIGLGITIDGANASDFTLTTPPTAPLAAGATTTFIIRFAPGALGNRSAALHIASNDANENPFDIILTGTTSQILFEDDFDPGIDTPLWSAFGGTVTANTAGQAAGAGSTGNSLHFDGAGSRFATTIPLNTTSGGAIAFKIALGNGVSPWETADSGEDAVLEYSNDGTAYTQIGGPYTSRTWQSIVVGIPAAAQTPATRFRWRQLSNSGSGFDHWAIEDVQIGPAIGTAPEIAVEQPAGTGLTDGVSSVNFGSVATGSNASLTFTVRNTGSADLTGLAVTIDGANAAEFSVTTAPATTVAVGSTTTFAVRFAPGAAGSRSAALHIASNDGDENPFDIGLLGTGLSAATAEISVEQPAGTALVDGSATVSFGNVGTGVGAILAFTVRNSGTAALSLGTATLSGATPGAFDILTQPTASLAPSATSIFYVRYIPSTTGGHSAVLSIPSNDSDENPFDIALTGTGVSSGPELVVDTTHGNWLIDEVSTTSFGTVHLGTDHTLVYNIRNVGSDPLTGVSITIDGTNAANFSVVTPPAATVAPGEGTFCVVQLIPTTTTATSAVMHILSNDADEASFEVNLIGTSASGAPEIVVESNVSSTTGTGLTDGVSVVDIGGLVTGENRTVMFTIRNTGTGALTGIDCTLSGPDSGDFAVVTAPPTSLRGSSNFSNFFIRFNPSSPGAKTAILSITSNDTDENPFEVTLTASASVRSTSIYVVESIDRGWYWSSGRHTPSNLNYNTGFSPSGGFRSRSYFAFTLPALPPGQAFVSAEIQLLCPSNGYSSADASEDIVFNEYAGPINTLRSAEAATAAYADLADGPQFGGPFPVTSAINGTTVAIPLNSAFLASANVRQGGDLAFGMSLSTLGTSFRSESVFAFSNNLPSNVRLVLTSAVVGVPEIAIEQPAGFALTDAASTVSFGPVAEPVTRVFTIQNAGSSDLTGISVGLDGTHAADFSIVSPPAATVAAGASTTFALRFIPSTLGARTAALHIASNDSDENPFDIALSATAVTPAGGLDDWLPPALPDRTPTGTPHDDGVPNLLKYAFNLDANAPDHRTLVPGGTSGLPAIGRQQPGPTTTVFRFEYLRRIGSGLIYTPQKNDSLDTGGWVPLSSLPVITPINETWERVVHEEPVDVLVTPKCFGRVRVHMP